MRFGKSLALLALAGAAFASSAFAAEPLYHPSKTIPLGAPDRWDYATFDDGRIYVAHGDRITVVDAAANAVVGQVEGTPGGSHGIALYHPAGKGYSDDGKAGVVVVFDLKSLKVLKTVKAEEDADGIVLDPASNHLFVIDGDSGKVTVIDPKTDAVVSTIDVGGGLEFGAADGRGTFFVDGSEKGEMIRIDTKTNKVTARWPLQDCVKSHGLAMDRETRRLFVSCSNKVMAVVNADSGAILAKLPIGEGTDFAVFDPVRKRAFSSNRDGTLSVIAEKDADHFEALPPVKTAYGARTMTIDPKTGRLYFVAADFDINTAVPESDPRHRYTVKPGTAKLLVFEPAK